MALLEYTTAGESHGPAVVVLVMGVPAGLAVDVGLINRELERRQGGYGRGARQRIEHDTVEFLGGLRQGRTIGSPVAMRIANADSRLDDPAKTPAVFRPRPGHADLAGSLKYLTPDCRGVLERASARETAGRTAAGALARGLLRVFEIEVLGFVRSIGGEGMGVEPGPASWREVLAARDGSETYCPDPAATERQREAIRRAKVDKDTLGGVIEAHAFGVPPGLGTCMDWRERLDARLAYAAMAIQAIKSVEIGLGREVAERPGSRVHDPIALDPSLVETHQLGFARGSNNAGGLEGGMSNGQPVVVRAAMKPISTLLRGMPSVDLRTGAAETSAYERSDICAVPAASVVLENVVAFEIARALLAKFGGDTMDEVKVAYDSYLRMARMTMGPAGPGTRLA